jgi:hypothetical protein
VAFAGLRAQEYVRCERPVRSLSHTRPNMRLLASKTFANEVKKSLGKSARGMCATIAKFPKTVSGIHAEFVIPG